MKIIFYISIKIKLLKNLKNNNLSEIKVIDKLLQTIKVIG